MANITPGYDFAVTEIPTVTTMLKQATGLQISGISASELEAGIAGIKSGDVSNVTDSLQIGETVGTIWVSPLGDVWVQEQSGPVILSRIEYGWETRRLFVRSDASASTYLQPGGTCHQDSVTGIFEDTFRTEEVNNTRYTGTPRMSMTNDGSYDDNQGGMMWGCIQGETATSPGHYQRIAFRGLVLFTDRASSGSTHSKEWEMGVGCRIKRPSGSGGATHMIAENLGTGLNRSSSKWFGWAGCPSPSSSKVSNGIGVLGAEYKKHFMLWAFGGMSYSNKQTGLP